MQNHYIDSWELYKIHSEIFVDDYEYYFQFCKGHKTLELFAGYGRLANFLSSKGIDIETVELEKKFASFIKLPNEKNHICDVLKFTSNYKFERIIAGYNSFCLFLEDEKIIQFFEKVESLLEKDGLLSLSYYPISAWEKSEPQEFIYKNEKLTYKSDFDMSFLNKNIAVWIDEYKGIKTNVKFEYPARVYLDTGDLLQFLTGTKLKLIDIIDNYNKENIDDPGWQEFVFQKG